MTANQAPRQNRDGHPCPLWCTVDHDEVINGITITGHGGDVTVTQIREYEQWITARAYLAAAPGRTPEIQVGMTPGGDVFVPSRHAEDLAALVELLAAATPGQHRKLAAAIRKAAADIAETTREDR